MKIMLTLLLSVALCSCGGGGSDEWDNKNTKTLPDTPEIQPFVAVHPLQVRP